MTGPDLDPRRSDAARRVAEGAAQWAAVRDAAFAREVDALLTDLFPEEESRG